MKVLAVLLMAVSWAAARGSGPYLPSGWRPEGPAFFLPGEVSMKPAENPLKDTLFQESEGSSSDFLREYGPPKEVSQDLTQQGLPDLVTEQAFVVIRAKFNEEVKVDETGEDMSEGVTTTEEAVTEKSSTVAEELATVTEAEIIGDVTTELKEEVVQGRAFKLEVEASVAETTGFEESVVTESQDIKDITVEEEKVEGNLNEKTVQEFVNSEVKAVEQIIEQNENIQQEINSEVKKVEENLEESVRQSVNILEEVKNIAQEIVKVESKNAQEQNIELSGLKSVEISGSEQAPEGFLEYGPPGFREYGPPKGDELLQSAAVQEKSEAELIENNETRRRRFSPKFRAGKN